MPSATRSSARLGLLRLAAAGIRPTIGPPREPQRVLLLRPDHIGDVLLTSPAVALLRDSLPAARLTYVVGPWSLDAARHGPRVDHLRSIAFPGFTRRVKANLVAPYALLVREALRLRRERYDLAVVLRADHWWGAMLVLAAGIPMRVGYELPETAPLLTHTRPVQPEQPAAEQALDLARLALAVCQVPARDFADGSVGAGSARKVPAVETRPLSMFRVTAAEEAAATAIWDRFGLNGRCVVGIHPNAGAALKSWPLDSWASLADRLIERDLGVVLLGAPGDAALLAAIRTRMSRGLVKAEVEVACGQSLGISAALYARCTVLVSVDSGAAHLAAAVGTPTVRLYGPASSAVFGPWPVRPDQQVLVARHLACIPCGNLEAPPCGATRLPACLLALGAGDVLNAIERELARN